MQVIGTYAGSSSYRRTLPQSGSYATSSKVNGVHTINVDLFNLVVR